MRVWDTDGEYQTSVKVSFVDLSPLGTLIVIFPCPQQQTLHAMVNDLICKSSIKVLDHGRNLLV